MSSFHQTVDKVISCIILSHWSPIRFLWSFNSNTTGATDGAWSTYPSEVHKKSLKIPKG